jgi:hypothetical protein
MRCVAVLREENHLTHWSATVLGFPFPKKLEVMPWMFPVDSERKDPERWIVENILFVVFRPANAPDHFAKKSFRTIVRENIFELRTDFLAAIADSVYKWLVVFEVSECAREVVLVLRECLRTIAETRGSRVNAGHWDRPQFAFLSLKP